MEAIPPILVQSCQRRALWLPAHTLLPETRMEPEMVQVEIGAGITTVLLSYALEQPDGRPVLVWMPAMGVRADYYRQFAEQLREAGLNTVLVELRGYGRSSERASWKCNFGFWQLLSHDLPPIMEAVRARFPGSPVWMGGHSLGGQLAALYAVEHGDALAGLVFAAVTFPHYRNWPFPRSLAILGLGVAARALSLAVGHLPGHVFGFAGREARNVIRDWFHTIRKGRFHLPEAPLDYEEGLGRVRLPLLEISFSDDRYASRASTKAIGLKMSPRHVERWIYHPQDLGLQSIGHFSWAKAGAQLPARIAGYLLEQSG